MKNDSGYSRPLQQVPRIAQKIGSYFARFAQLEFSLWMLSVHLFGNDLEKARNFWSSHNTFGNRLKELQKLVNESKLPETEDLTCIFNDAEECKEFRNGLAHGYYHVGKEDSKKITLDPNPWKEKSELIFLTESLLDCQELKVFRLVGILNHHWNQKLINSLKNRNFPILADGKSYKS
jgi:hypothetical protein